MIEYISTSRGWMENRNGCPDIGQVEAMLSKKDPDVMIGGVNKSGRILRGGICMDQAAAIELARLILKELAPEFLMTESEKP